MTSGFVPIDVSSILCCCQPGFPRCSFCLPETKPNTKNDRLMKMKKSSSNGRVSIRPIPPNSYNGTNNKCIQPMPTQTSLRDSLLKQSVKDSIKPSNKATNTDHTRGNGAHPPPSLSNTSASSTYSLGKTSIYKRPVRERLVHLLALRPFKKIEILERLNKEGLREKGCVTLVLQQIAYTKDNTYHLSSASWREVQDDWPFYTETEKQILRRRKSRNITSSGSSDSCSSSSGQSPIRTSPEIASPTLTSYKRPGYFDDASGLPTKRLRVSHCNDSTRSTINPPLSKTLDSKPSDATEINKGTSISINDKIASTINPQLSKTLESKPSDCTDISNETLNSINDKIASSDSNVTTDKSSDLQSGQKLIVADDTPNSYCNRESNDRVEPSGNNASKEQKRTDSSNFNNKKHKDIARKNDRKRKSSSSSPGINSPLQKVQFSVPDPVPIRKDVSLPSADYLTKYTRIQTPEQRNQYKKIFDDDYAEYKLHHAFAKAVSERFIGLEDIMNKEGQESPIFEYVMMQTIKEYNANIMNHLRFHYLHDKLAHIKQLIKEYDQLN